jgi:hypothetical protein
MKSSIPKFVAALVVLAAGMTLTIPTYAKDDLPDVTTDRLKRVKSKNVNALYLQDGATLEGYTEVYLVDCAVAFRKNWERDYNRDQYDLSKKVRQSDMDTMKSKLSTEFKEEFTKVLEKGGYKVVTETAPHVLILRPAIINLDVSAPATNRSTGMSRTYTASAGSMTLYLELYDAETSAKIAEVVDSRSAGNNVTFQISNSVTNKSEADRLLKNWASLLVKALDEANGK